MTQTQQDAKGGNALWIGIVVVVLALGVVAVVVARGKGDDDAAPSVRRASGQCPSATVTTTDDGSGAQDLPDFAGTDGDDAVCRTIPTISGKDLDGKAMTIGPDGTAKVVMFVAHWCPHCQREVPLIAAHLRDAPLPDDVELVTVSTAVRPDAGNYPPKAWLEDERWPARVLADTSDGADATAYGLTSFPYFVVADAEGRVVVRTSGELTTDEFDDLVEAARTGRPPV